VGRGARAVKAHPLYIHTYIVPIGPHCIEHPSNITESGRIWRKTLIWSIWSDLVSHSEEEEEEQEEEEEYTGLGSH
jgi:hypothetical protein